MHKDVEEILELIWTFKEKGRTADRETVVRTSKVDNTADFFEGMIRDGLIAEQGGIISLTPSGDKAGESVVRRLRLAEWLLSNVLELEPETWEDTACEFEHVLSPEVTDSICTFLGHPPTCPHGEPIPRGECCRAFSREIRPLVLNVTELGPGERGRIVFIAPRHHDRLDRLSAIGLIPGAVVKVHQKQPTYVLDVGETSVAIDGEIAREIFVKRVKKD